MEKMQMVKVTECRQSPTNAPGRNAGPAFDDLVKSIKEKGVLVPILVREVASKHVSGQDEGYEVIAGNRRFAAASKAGLKEIPAMVREMTDDEAQEAQIVENLQRQDIHPLEEGEAYRKLIEDGGRTVEDVAVKVGKKEDYVRQRLFLTNLAPKLRQEYRNGNITDSSAALVARLSGADQERILKDDGYILHNRTTADLKEWIKKEIYKPLAHQPWVSDPKIAKLVGPCKECPPNRAALFGDIKAGVCTDIRCWSRKMDVYLEYRMKEGKLVPVVEQYGEPDRKTIGGRAVLTQNNFERVPAKGKDRCKFAIEALIVEGANTGNTMWICADKACKKHHPYQSDYQQTPVELKKRKEQLKKKRASDLAKYNAFAKTVGKKVKWPFAPKVLDFLFDDVVAAHGVTSLERIAHRLEIKRSGHDGYKPGIRAHYEKATPSERAAITIELILLRHYESERNAMLKKI